MLLALGLSCCAWNKQVTHFSYPVSILLTNRNDKNIEEHDSFVEDIEQGPMPKHKIPEKMTLLCKILY